MACGARLAARRPAGARARRGGCWGHGEAAPQGKVAHQEVLDVLLDGTGLDVARQVLAVAGLVVDGERRQVAVRQPEEFPNLRAATRTR